MVLWWIPRNLGGRVKRSLSMRQERAAVLGQDMFVGEGHRWRGKEAWREACPNAGKEFGEWCGLQMPFCRLYVMLQQLQVINDVGSLVASMGFFYPWSDAFKSYLFRTPQRKVYSKMLSWPSRGTLMYVDGLFKFGQCKKTAIIPTALFAELLLLAISGP